MQDSIINVDEYVTKKIARALAKALDTAIAKEPVIIGATFHDRYNLTHRIGAVINQTNLLNQIF